MGVALLKLTIHGFEWTLRLLKSLIKCQQNDLKNNLLMENI